MERKEMLTKWAEKIKKSLNGKVVPEIAVKKIIKTNREEFLKDCQLIDEYPIMVFNNLVDMIIKWQNILDKNSRCSCYADATKPKFGLDYYDNRRDRFFSTDLVPYQGQFGAYFD